MNSLPGARTTSTAYVLLTFMAVCFGGTWVAGKVAVGSIPPMTVAACRFAIASVLLWLWTHTKSTTTRRLMMADLPIILGMGLTAIAGYNTFFLYGLTLAPASDGAIIVPGLTPILTATLAWPFLGERPRPRGIGGLVIALLGLSFVIAPSTHLGVGRMLGDVLFLLGAGCWAIYSIIGKAATARFTPVHATLYGTVAGTLALLPFALAEHGWTRLATAATSAWVALLFLAVFGTVVAFVFFYEGVSRIGAARAASFAFLVPFFGVLSSVILLGERLTPLTVAGGGLVVLGLGLVQGPSVARVPRVPHVEPTQFRG